MTESPPRYAAFVSPHGFGHAARASGAMVALHERTGARFEIFSTVPPWFFQESLGDAFRHHEVVCDVGFVQASALHTDIPATVASLGELLPYDEGRVADLAKTVLAAGCRAVLCDISPMGVAVAEAAGLPSVLVENFTWPWLYSPYVDQHPELRRLSGVLEEWRARADVVVQTAPHCNPDRGAELVAPISRPPRTEPEVTRARLDVPDRDRLVVVTMGGYGEPLGYLPRLRDVPDTTFVVTGAAETAVDGNLRLFSNRVPIFMPDLIHAADGVVAKLGYGTIAEVWAENLPFGFVSRPENPEMPPLEAFVEREIHSTRIDSETFAGGDWMDVVAAWPRRERGPRRVGGADRVAEIIEARASVFLR